MVTTVRGVVSCLVLGLLLLDPVLCEKRIWMITIGDDWGAHEYRNAEGYLKGFGPELIDAVCQQGGMDCRMVWAPYSTCWVTSPGEHPHGGNGLLQSWFDACSSWVPTVERIHTFSFTLPYMKKVHVFFFSAKGTSFDSSDLTGKRIGFATGWAETPQCVARQSNIANNVLSTSQTVFKDNIAGLFDALKSGEIEAVLLPKTAWSRDQLAELQYNAASGIRCILSGTSFMARKDSEFIAAWNTGFSKLKNTPRFAKLCKDSNLRHSARGSEIECIGQ